VYDGLDLEASFKVYNDGRRRSHANRTREAQLLRVLRRSDPCRRELLRLLLEEIKCESDARSCWQRGRSCCQP